jgi:hypothetical protein
MEVTLMSKQLVVSTRFEALAEEFNEHDKQAGQSFVAMLNTQHMAKLEYQEATGKVHGFIDAWSALTGKSLNTIKQYNYLGKKIAEGSGWESVQGMSKNQIDELLHPKEEDLVFSDIFDFLFLGKGKDYLYLITNPGFDGWVKVGESNDVVGRVKQFQTASPYKYAIEAVYEMPFGFSDKKLHKMLPVERSGEWFRCDIEKLKTVLKEEMELENLMEEDYDELSCQ